MPLARRGNGARTYAALECGVGVLGLVSLPLLHGIDPAVGALYRSLGAESAGFALARFAILFILLLPATALMGATLPVLVAHLGRGLVGEELAGLYAVNTFGAVAGSLAGGFALLPAIGLAGTVWVAAAINFVVAAVAWRVSVRSAAPADTAAGAPAVARGALEASAAAGTPARRPGGHGPARTPAAPAGPSPAPFPRAAFAALFALSGFAALVFQIAWVRLFALVFGSSVYSFSAVLGVYLLGLALGSAAIGRFMRGGVSVALFGRLQVALAVAAPFMLPAFSRLHEWMYALGERAGARWNVLLGGARRCCALRCSLRRAPCSARRFRWRRGCSRCAMAGTPRHCLRREHARHHRGLARSGVLRRAGAGRAGHAPRGTRALARDRDRVPRDRPRAR